MSRTWAVIGGGIKGIRAAYELLKAGQKVVLIERDPALGGILNSRPWNGFLVDPGCHLIDLQNADEAAFFDFVLGDKLGPLARSYSSRTGGHVSKGFGVPDFSQFPQEWRERALRDLQNAAAMPHAPTGTLSDAFHARFGATLGAEMCKVAAKYTGIDPSDLSHRALATLPALHRARIGPDAQMRVLKKESALDPVLAASNIMPEIVHSLDKGRSITRTAYPTTGTMAQVGHSGASALRRAGAQVLTQSAITQIEPTDQGLRLHLSEADKTKQIDIDYLYWTLLPDHLASLVGVEKSAQSARQNARAVGVLLYAFEVPGQAICDLTYVQDYDPATTAMRHASMGRYSRQSKANGNSFITSEVTARAGSALWQNAEALMDQVFTEARNAGIIEGVSRPADATVFRFPVTAVLPAPNAQAPSEQAPLNTPERIFMSASSVYGKVSIGQHVKQQIQTLVRDTQ